VTPNSSSDQRAALVWAAYEQEMLAPLMALMRAGMESGEILPGDERILARAFCSLLDAFSTPGGHKMNPSTASQEALARGDVALPRRRSAKKSAS
jgi:hypothetical protein